MRSNQTKKTMPITAIDPHHDEGIMWGWDGTFLWAKPVTGDTWTRVERIHPTRHRCRTLAELMSFSTEELRDLRNVKSST